MTFREFDRWFTNGLKKYLPVFLIGAAGGATVVALAYLSGQVDFDKGQSFDPYLLTETEADMYERELLEGGTYFVDKYGIRGPYSS